MIATRNTACRAFALSWVLVVGLAVPIAAAADIYRWTDDQGRVHFSQTPPVQRPSEQLTPQPSTRGADFSSDGMEHFNQQRSEQRQQAREQSQQQRQAEAQRAAICAAAQRRMAALQATTARRLAIEQPDGSVSRASESQFQALRAKAQQNIDQNC